MRFIRYNANPKGWKTGDCVIRAVAAATQQTWDDVYDELSIFDWWTDKLGISRLEDMRKFLREAIKLGYTGYVCFKVGMSGCANGMWAHKKESTDGYSPDGPTLYKSFTPDYEYWSVMDDDKDYLPREEYNKLKTIKMLEDFMKEVGLYE